MASIQQNQAALLSHVVLNLPLRWLVVKLGAHHYLNVYAEDLASRYGDAKTSSAAYAFSVSAPLTEAQAAQVAAQIGQSKIPTYQGWGDLASHATEGRVMRASEVFGLTPEIGVGAIQTDLELAKLKIEVARLQSENDDLKGKVKSIKAQARAALAEIAEDVKRFKGEASASPSAPQAPPQEAPQEQDKALRVWATGWLAARKAKSAKSWRPLMNEAIQEGIASADTTPRELDKIAASTLA